PGHRIARAAPSPPGRTGTARRVREPGPRTAIPFRSVTAAALRTTAPRPHAHEGVHPLASPSTAATGFHGRHARATSPGT
ncbi:hypothetical protein B7767_26380, partial [Streptomyces sp. 13-12-16]|uniref:hypothetical protein n=1 Tax=Streptomyces sp. 13-12-16 TaxID=1570823 RepID=UPI000A22651B